MNWPPKITIVTPSYQQGEFLEETIMSVLGQGYPHLEYIIMDGGSSDGSLEIIKKYDSKLSFWQSQKDKGQADAVNQGLRRGTGELMAYLNSDDKLIEGSLWKMAYLARQYPHCDVFYGANYMHFEDGGIVYECPRPWIPGRALGGLQDATFWRSTVHKVTGYFDESYQFALCNDFFSRTLLKHRVLFHSEPMSIIRRHPNSKTSTMSDVSLSDGARICERYQKLTIPLAWKCRAQLIQKWAGMTAWLGRYHAKLIWRITMPPIS